MRKFSNTARGSRTRRAAGFTLVELVIALAVLLILLAVGIPQSMSLMANNRLTSQANELVQAFSIARSEAIKRTAVVRVVPADATDWTKGWSLVADANRDGDFTDSGDLVRIGNAVPGTITMTADATNNMSNGYVAFNTRGALMPLGDTFAYQLSVSDCEGYQVRVVRVAASGQVGVSTMSCP